MSEGVSGRISLPLPPDVLGHLVLLLGAIPTRRLASSSREALYRVNIAIDELKRLITGVSVAVYLSGDRYPVASCDPSVGPLTRVIADFVATVPGAGKSAGPQLPAQSLVLLMASMLASSVEPFGGFCYASQELAFTGLSPRRLVATYQPTQDALATFVVRGHTDDLPCPGAEPTSGVCGPFYWALSRSADLYVTTERLPVPPDAWHALGERLARGPAHQFSLNFCARVFEGSCEAIVCESVLASSGDIRVPDGWFLGRVGWLTRLRTARVVRLE